MPNLHFLLIFASFCCSNRVCAHIFIFYENSKIYDSFGTWCEFLFSSLLDVVARFTVDLFYLSSFEAVFSDHNWIEIAQTVHISEGHCLILSLKTIKIHPVKSSGNSPTKNNSYRVGGINCPLPKVVAFQNHLMLFNKTLF
jgi:hypothetical protein